MYRIASLSFQNTFKCAYKLTIEPLDSLVWTRLDAYSIPIPNMDIIFTNSEVFENFLEKWNMWREPITIFTKECQSIGSFQQGILLQHLGTIFSICGFSIGLNTARKWKENNKKFQHVQFQYNFSKISNLVQLCIFLLSLQVVSPNNQQNDLDAISHVYNRHVHKRMQPFIDATWSHKISILFSRISFRTFRFPYLLLHFYQKHMWYHLLSLLLFLHSILFEMVHN